MRVEIFSRNGLFAGTHNMVNKRFLSLLEKGTLVPPNHEIKCFFQAEHNLVLEGGRGVSETNCVGHGNVKSIYGDETYLVRVDNLEDYSNYDLILEYSLPNVYNIKLSQKFDDSFMEKIVYLPPMIYDFYEERGERSINFLTTYVDVSQERRKNILSLLEESSLEHRNINTATDKGDLMNILDDTKIMLNIHQTDHHHTLEEFRVLPALQRGVVVVSENVPLKEKIPYCDYVVWCDYSDIMETLKEVENNYDFYYNEFFGKKSNLKNILQNMEDEALNNIEEKMKLHARRNKNVKK